ncbi:MAG: ATP-binding protein, partial [Erysipelotrichaceae bacterium]|nr:ATP-binding protein [Erysipelotrichaceae bacterium]
MNEKVEHSYTSEDIQVLEGLEAVRKRPGMYIGTTSSRGLHHLVWEIVDNAIDEALAGYATDIIVTVDKDNVVSVEDNGRGMPVGIHEKTKVSSVETIFTVLHAGGKFGGGAYKVSGGLHGVGASVVNALSQWVEVTVYKEGKVYQIRFEHGGNVVAPLKEIGTCEESKHGSLVRFKADPMIFTETQEYNHEILRDRFRQIAFLNKGIKIIFHDLRMEEESQRSITFYYEGGL